MSISKSLIFIVLFSFGLINISYSMDAAYCVGGVLRNTDISFIDKSIRVLDSETQTLHRNLLRTLNSWQDDVDDLFVHVLSKKFATIEDFIFDLIDMVVLEMSRNHRPIIKPVVLFADGAAERENSEKLMTLYLYRKSFLNRLISILKEISFNLILRGKYMKDKKAILNL